MLRGLLCILLMLCACTAQAFIGDFAKIKTLYKDRQFAELVPVLKDYLALELKDARREMALFLLADSHYQQRQYSLCVKVLQDLLTQFPQGEYHAKALFLMGTAYARLNNYPKAMQAHGQILRLYPKDPLAHESIFWLAEAFYRLENYPKAIVFFEQLLKTRISEDREAQVRYLLGLCYVNTQQYEKALLQMDIVLKQGLPEKYRVPVRYRKANALKALGKLKQARAVYEDLLILKEQDSEFAYKAQFQIAVLHFEASEYDQALELLKDLEDDLNDYLLVAQSLTYQGLCYYNQNDYQQALKLWDRVIDTYPALAFRAHYHKAWALLQLDKMPEAIAVLTELSETFFKHPLRADILLLLAELLWTDQNPQKSLQYWTQVSESYPQTEQASVALFERASYALSQRQYEYARELFVQIDAQSSVAIERDLRLVEIYLQRNEFSVAREILQDLQNKTTTVYVDQNIEYFWALSFEQEKQWPQAIDFYERSMNGIDSELVVKSLLGLARVYERMDNYEQASSLYDSVVRKYPSHKDLDLYYKAQLGLARSFQKMKLWASAKTVLSTVLKSQSASYQRLAREQLALLQEKMKEGL